MNTGICSLVWTENSLELDDILAKIRQLVAHISSAPYMWSQYRPQFHRSTVSNKFSVLFAYTQMDESVEDERILLYILWRVSKEFPHAFFRTSNSHGEFPLFEIAAAQERNQEKQLIPDWIEPGTDQCRVWINNGEIVIFKGNTSISIEQALDQIKAGDPTSTYSNPSLTAAIALEWDNFEMKERELSKQSRHRFRVYLPRRLATVLHHNPEYLASALFANTEDVCEPSESPFDRDLISCVLTAPKRVFVTLVAEAGGVNKAGKAPDTIGTLIHALMCNYYLQEDRGPVQEEIETDLENQGYPRLKSNRQLYSSICREHHEKQKSFRIQIETVKPITDNELKLWDQTEDDISWLVDDGLKGDPPELDAEKIAKNMQSFVERTEKDIEEWNEYVNETSGDEMVDGDTNTKIHPPLDEDKQQLAPDIDEDDFFEYFLQEALQLSPEEIAKFRTSQKAKDPNGKSDQLFSLTELRELIESLKETGNIGPVSSFLAQLGVDYED